MRLTHEHLKQSMSEGGGFNKQQLELLGVEWPPLKGWQRSIIGMDFSDDELHGAYKVALGKQAEDMKPEAAADIDDMPERKDSRTGGTLDAKWLKQNF